MTYKQLLRTAVKLVAAIQAVQLSITARTQRLTFPGKLASKLRRCVTS